MPTCGKRKQDGIMSKGSAFLSIFMNNYASEQYQLVTESHQLILLTECNNMREGIVPFFIL